MAFKPWQMGARSILGKLIKPGSYVAADLVSLDVDFSIEKNIFVSNCSGVGVILGHSFFEKDCKP